MSDREEFSVVCFNRDGTYFYSSRWTDAETAVTHAKSLTERPAAKAGTVSRVIITDGGDFTVFEWQFGKGVTFPTRKIIKNSRGL